MEDGLLFVGLWLFVLSGGENATFGDRSIVEGTGCISKFKPRVRVHPLFRYKINISMEININQEGNSSLERRSLSSICFSSWLFPVVESSLKGV